MSTPLLSLSKLIRPTLFGLILLLVARRTADTLPRDIWFGQLIRSSFGSTLGQPPVPLWPVSPADAAYGRGWFAWQAGDIPAAESAWSLAMVGNEQYVPVMRSVAAHDRPLATLATTTYPHNAESWAWLAGIVAAEDQDYSTATGLYERAAGLAPFDNLIWEQLAGVALAAGDPILSQASAERACDLVPIRNGSCHSAARLAYAKGDWATVIYYYERGDYPEHVEDWVQLMVAAQQLGRTADAQRYLSQAQLELPADYDELLKQVNP
jgi:tetratricopeptide (TPR) repeat protein